MLVGHSEVTTSAGMDVQSLYPISSQANLDKAFLGKSLHDSLIPLPAAVLDVSIIRKNCQDMLDAVSSLDVFFRAHVKTHKTTSLARLQVGTACRDVRLVVSTVIEAEHLVPLCQAYQTQGAVVNLLYGVPLGKSNVDRLAECGKALGEGSISVMVDNTDQLPYLRRFRDVAAFVANVFVKVDQGYHRAGLRPGSEQMKDLFDQVVQIESAQGLRLEGLYSHAGHSYAGSNPEDAMKMLKLEIDACQDVAKQMHRRNGAKPLVISVGASPTALSVQNLQNSDNSGDVADSLHVALSLDKALFELELHAGVYPLLDMQQVSTHARRFSADPHDSIAITVMAEVLSLYDDRDKPEGLIGAGVIALGREPCKSYAGWGVVTPWKRQMADDDSRLIVSYVAQEHGKIKLEGESSSKLAVHVGQRIRIWPNHACIASASYGWYLVVDSSSSVPDRIIEVWPRWRGW